MSKRTNKELLSDVVEAIDKILLYTKSMEFEDFAHNDSLPRLVFSPSASPTRSQT